MGRGRTVAGSHPWERDNALTELAHELRGWQGFLKRGGSPNSANGQRRRRRIHRLKRQVEENPE